MTDQEMLGLLRADIRGVSDAVIGLGREVSGLHVKIDTVCSEVERNRADIRDLQREDATGRVEIEALRGNRSRPPGASGGLALLPVLRAVGPWLAAVLVGLGVYLGSGGDEAAMANAIRAVNDTTIKLTRKIDRLETEQEEAHALDDADTDPLR